MDVQSQTPANVDVDKHQVFIDQLSELAGELCEHG